MRFPSLRLLVAVPLIGSAASANPTLIEFDFGTWVAADLSVSADGSRVGVAVADAVAQASIRSLPGGGSIFSQSGNQVGTPALSADGDTAVGWYDDVGISQAYRWTGGSQDLFANDTLPTALSADGNVFAGQTDGTFEAYVATFEVGGPVYTPLGDLPGGGTDTLVTSLSGDGLVAVGVGSSASGSEAFRWDAGAGIVGLGNLPGGTASRASDVSYDGAVVVGWSTTPSGNQAFRWNALDGLVFLGALPGDTTSRAMAVSDDGAVIVGTSSDGSTVRPFIWDDVNGIRPLEDLLAGVDLSGIELHEAMDLSGDGTTIVGTGEGIDIAEISFGQTILWAATVPDPTASPAIPALPWAAALGLFAALAGVAPVAGRRSRRRAS